MAKMPAMSWDDLRFFHEVIRAGSIRAAARRLGVDHATVSRRVSHLESSLNVKLLVRNADGVSVTDAGEQLSSATEEAHGVFQSVQRRIGGLDSPLAGRVRVSTHAVLGADFLISPLVAFRLAHDSIEIDLDLSPEVRDLAMNQADLAVRVTNVPPEDTIARRAAGFAYAVYASEAYLANHAPRKDPTACSWIGWEEDGPYPTSLKDDFPTILVRDRFAAIPSQVSAAAAGLGLAALPCFLADADSRLKRVSEPREVTSVFVLRHPDHRSTARVRELYEHLRRFIEEHAARLEGRI